MFSLNIYYFGEKTRHYVCSILIFHISTHVDLWPNYVSFYYFISPSMLICGQTMFHSIISYLHPCWFVTKLCFILLFHISIHVDLWPNYVSFYYFISPSMLICGQTVFHSIISYLHPCWFVTKLCFILLFHISIHVDLWPNFVSFYYFISPSMLVCGQTVFHSIISYLQPCWFVTKLCYTVWPQTNMDGDMK